ncbi:MAG TPA: hypothetical protein VHK44_01390, partial [Xanthobacteraceae bacterium]|nr:hypothetical protein [Xanthobacteraceae bacterium]
MGLPCGPLAPIWTKLKPPVNPQRRHVATQLCAFTLPEVKRPPDQAALLVPIAPTELVEVASNFS